MTSPSDCELCSSPLAEPDTGTSSSFAVLPQDQSPDGPKNAHVSICKACTDRLKTLSSGQQAREKDWSGLAQAIWTDRGATQVLIYRILKTARSETWANDLLDQLYLDESHLAWADLAPFGPAQGAASSENDRSHLSAKDCNGTALADGDSVLLIKDLDVKGAGFTAKRGTLVKKISLTSDPGLIEARVNGTQIVLKTEFLKKS